MWDLRWVLLGLGILFLAGVYLWTRGLLPQPKLPQFARRAVRREPHLGEEPQPPPAAAETESLVETIEEPQGAGRGADRIVAMRLVPRGGELGTERAIAALRGAGLERGRYSIFHRQVGIHAEGFSVASLTEPGTFEADPQSGATIAGLSFFVVLPGHGDPVARFDAMVETARALSVELEADLFDERGSSWSSQRERYLREELIEYRHQLERR